MDNLAHLKHNAVCNSLIKETLDGINQSSMTPVSEVRETVSGATLGPTHASIMDAFWRESYILLAFPKKVDIL
jgi:hypothetical protein